MHTPCTRHAHAIHTHYAQSIVHAHTVHTPLYTPLHTPFHTPCVQVPGCKKNMLNWDIAPFGMEKLTKWIHRRYAPGGGIVVTGNGLPLREDSAEQARCDARAMCHASCHALCPDCVCNDESAAAGAARCTAHMLHQAVLAGSCARDA